MKYENLMSQKTQSALVKLFDLIPADTGEARRIYDLSVKILASVQFYNKRVKDILETKRNAQAMSPGEEKEACEISYKEMERGLLDAEAYTDEPIRLKYRQENGMTIAEMAALEGLVRWEFDAENEKEV